LESETLTASSDSTEYPRDVNDRPMCTTKGLIASVCLVTAAISAVSYSVFSKTSKLETSAFESMGFSHRSGTTVHAYVDAL